MSTQPNHKQNSPQTADLVFSGLAAAVDGEGILFPTGTEATFDQDQKFVDDLKTPPENDAVYGVIREDDPDVIALAESMRIQGVLEPIVISVDDYIISGNRRRLAAKMAGWPMVPVRVVNITHDDPDFIRLLVEHNKQRVKTIDQQAREITATMDPEVAYRQLVEIRRKSAEINVTGLCLGEEKTRSAIKGNRPLADACIKIVDDMQEQWPLSDRQIHYILQNDAPLIHERKSTRYGNNVKSYRALTNVLTRLRLAGEIPFEAIADVTRAITIYQTHNHPQEYLRHELDNLFTNYWRNLQQSQPNHIELVAEKLTVQNTVKKVARDYTIPLTVGRGFCSITPRHEMFERWRKSGKDKLVIVIVSDLDPAGMTIAESFGRSLRDDFGVPAERLEVVKAALTIEQVQEMNLPPTMEAKAKASTAREYIERYGNHVWELEAIHPDKLCEIVRETCLQVMDVDALNHEQRMETQEANVLAGYRKAVLATFDQGQEFGGDQ